MRADSEGKPDIHATRIGFHRLIDEVSDIGEVDDFLQPVSDLVMRHTKQQCIEDHIVSAGLFRIETGAQFQQCCDPPTCPNPA
ncbi:hypothetical protein D9M72_633770 [compost metagenome]